MNYIITGGTGFIGTHLTNLIKERYPEAKVYNLDIVKPSTPNPVVKNYKPAVKEGETLQSVFVECDIRKPIGSLPFTPTEEDIIFNFAAVHRTPGHEDHEYFETNIKGAENVCAFAEKYGIKKIVFTSSIAPYQETGGDYIPSNPVVTRTLTNDEGTAWTLDFALPQAPTFSSTFTFVGVDEQGNVETDEVSTSEVQIALTIPRGAKLFAGTEVSSVSQVVIEGAEPGDVYLNTSTGYLYKLDSAGTWNQQEGTIQGPVGDALHIVASYTINETEDFTDSLVNGVSYIEQNYQGTINDEDIFAVTWVGLEDGNQTSYWYYKLADGTWGRVQLTGGISGLIESTYNDESNGPETNKTYSINYINTLIGGDIASKNKDLVTYSAAQVEELLSWGTF